MPAFKIECGDTEPAYSYAGPGSAEKTATVTNKGQCPLNVRYRTKGASQPKKFTVAAVKPGGSRSATVTGKFVEFVVSCDRGTNPCEGSVDGLS